MEGKSTADNKTCDFYYNMDMIFFQIIIQEDYN